MKHVMPVGIKLPGGIVISAGGTAADGAVAAMTAVTGQNSEEVPAKVEYDSHEQISKLLPVLMPGGEPISKPHGGKDKSDSQSAKEG